MGITKHFCAVGAKFSKRISSGWRRVHLIASLCAWKPPAAEIKGMSFSYGNRIKVLCMLRELADSSDRAEHILLRNVQILENGRWRYVGFGFFFPSEQSVLLIGLINKHLLPFFGFWRKQKACKWPGWAKSTKYLRYNMPNVNNIYGSLKHWCSACIGVHAAGSRSSERLAHYFFSTWKNVKIKYREIFPSHVLKKSIHTGICCGLTFPLQGVDEAPCHQWAEPCCDLGLHVLSSNDRRRYFTSNERGWDFSNREQICKTASWRLDYLRAVKGTKFDKWSACCKAAHSGLSNYPVMPKLVQIAR